MFTDDASRARFAVVWVKDATWDAAERWAGRHPDKVHGLACNSRGLGLRVAAEYLDEVRAAVLGAEEAQKKRRKPFEVLGVPREVDRTALVEVLRDWCWAGLHIVASGFRRGAAGRRWVVAADGPPPGDQLSIDGWRVCVQEEAERTRGRRPDTARQPRTAAPPITDGDAWPALPRQGRADPPERRKDCDGKWYTRAEFDTQCPDNAEREWHQAQFWAADMGEPRPDAMDDDDADADGGGSLATTAFGDDAESMAPPPSHRRHERVRDRERGRDRARERDRDRRDSAGGADEAAGLSVRRDTGAAAPGASLEELVQRTVREALAQRTAIEESFTARLTGMETMVKELGTAVATLTANMNDLFKELKSIRKPRSRSSSRSRRAGRPAGGGGSSSVANAAAAVGGGGD